MTWIATIVTFLIGYVLGRHSVKPEEIFSLQESINKRLRKKQKLGAVQRLTKEEAYVRSNPTLKAEEEEMGKAIEDMPSVL